MKRNSIKLLTAAILLVGAQQAFAQAAGTTAGVSVGNTANVNYKVGTVDQTQQTGTATFVVDRLLNVTVSSVGTTYTSVTPGATAQALEFTVTNNTNDQMDIGLLATNDADPYGTDAFDVTNFTYYVDDGDDVFEPGVGAGVDGAAVTFLDERTPDQVTSVWVVADIPANAVDNTTAGVKLTATLHDSTAATATAGFEGPDTLDGAVATADTGVDDPDTVQNVFGLLGPVGFDSDAYKAAGATITVAKIATVISDPLASANPKAVPGAVIEYCITVTNTGGQAALNVNIDDAIPANTTYVTDSIKVYSACNYASATAEDDDVVDEATDETDGTSGSKDGTGVHTQVSSLGAGDVTPQVTATMFHVTVN